MHHEMFKSTVGQVISSMRLQCFNNRDIVNGHYSLLGHIALGNSSFTSDISGRRYLENLSCNGDEATFGDCNYTAVDMQNCSSLDNIVAVRCAVTSKRA